VTVTSPVEIEPQLWMWRGWKISYVQQGTQGPCLLLVHGFGASTAHWRKNIEVLSQNYRVWAIDLLGFGRSEKPRQTYTGELWRDQMQAFCQEVVQEPVFVAGNSLGGYATLCFAADCPDWVRGVILINCAGPFSDEQSAPQSVWQSQLAVLQQQVLRLPFVIQISSFVLFSYIRQRSMIRKILLQVYKDPTAVTDRLIEEIYLPSCDPGALGVFAAVFKAPPGRKLDQLLETLTQPLLLLWGTADPWMPAQKAEKFQTYYPAAKLVLVDAGHCPHDECPTEVNQALDAWIQDQLR
jgi:pimeloyl-ACP methyl ester carboxylesterase